jgi:Sucrase/ferredoxin-like
VARPRTFCADVSREAREPLAATASRIDHWILIEYRGLWARDELAQSALPDSVKAHLRAQLASLPRSRLLFVRRPDRRRISRLAVFLARTTERDPRLTGLELEDVHDLLGVDVSTGPGEPLEHPLLVVCTHGKRDPCCARYGRPLYDALSEVADEGTVWQSTHVGGDRFAGNLVCFPEGLYFGRVERPDVLPLLDEYLAGRIRLERYRGRCCYPFHVQAAERAVREATGGLGPMDVRLTGQERLAEDRWRVRFAVGAHTLEADVARELGDLATLTCAATMPRRPRRYVARLAGTPRGRAA